MSHGIESLRVEIPVASSSNFSSVTVCPLRPKQTQPGQSRKHLLAGLWGTHCDFSLCPWRCHCHCHRHRHCHLYRICVVGRCRQHSQSRERCSSARRHPIGGVRRVPSRRRGRLHQHVSHPWGRTMRSDGIWKEAEQDMHCCIHRVTWPQSDTHVTFNRHSNIFHRVWIGVSTLLTTFEARTVRPWTESF